ncbi:hypothetical protein [Mechercharimyces sp. CAU 1602]|uniref:hypothetical protein n=1 Tax=Mechercharimyces sp. CAU 1602 TaxID=2973933 RepID=UPI00216115C7|nr:hypothetical protein [Mechercharimyces sp. CAU 1602]MCS1352207.1 hypothetical protein [Mechercharimyces sp. CAU 1602]
MIVWLDIGLGESEQRLLQHADWAAEVRVSKELKWVERAESIILSPQLPFAEVMKELARHKLTNHLRQCDRNTQSLLAVGVGMEVLFSHGGEYNDQRGLHLFAGEVQHKEGLNEPSWHSLKLLDPDPMLWGLQEKQIYRSLRHQVFPANREDIVAVWDQGEQSAAVVRRRQIWGIQPTLQQGEFSTLFVARFINQCKVG